MAFLLSGEACAQVFKFPISNLHLDEGEEKAVAACDLVLVERLAEYHPELTEPEPIEMEESVDDLPVLPDSEISSRHPERWSDETAPVIANGFPAGLAAGLFLLAIPIGIRNLFGKKKR